MLEAFSRAHALLDVAPSFALVALLLWFLGGVLVWASYTRNHDESVRLQSVIVALLVCAIAFGQTVELMWLASIAYVVYGVATLAGTLRVFDHNGYYRDLFDTVWSFGRVVRWTAMCDVAILFVLCLVERVVPYYVSLV